MIQHLYKTLEEVVTNNSSGDVGLILHLARYPIAKLILDEICRDIFFSVKSIIPDIEYTIVGNGWNNVFISAKSHSTKDSEHTIPVDKVIYEAIPEKYRKFFVFHSSTCYIDEEEAKNIKEVIEELHKEVKND